MAWIEIDYTDAETMAAAVAARMEAACRDAIAARGRAVLALAGGRSPLPAYRLWAACGLQGSRLYVIATDERCVPHDDPACNASALKAALAESRGISVTPLTQPDGDPERSIVHIEKALGYSPDDFDVVLLGMGADGHTASLFPGAPQLAAGLAPDGPDVLRIDPDPLPPEAPYPRITLSAQRLLRTRNLHLWISGAAKRDVLRAAQADPDPLRRPIAALLHAPHAMVHVHWCP